MKKYVSLILLLTVVLNTAVPVLGFSMAQRQIRKEMKRFILGKIPAGSLELIQAKVKDLKVGTSGLVFIHENEFRLAGKMYDIVRRDTVGGIVKFLVVNDTLEEKLIDKYTSYVQENFGGELGLKKQKFFKHIKVFSYEYFLVYRLAIMSYDTVNQIVNRYDSNKLKGFAEILTPPPEFSC